MFSPDDSGEVDSIVLIRTIVRAEPGFVGSHPRSEIREGRLRAELLAKLLARRLELAALAANPARPGVPPQRVDHRAAHAPLGEGLELDASRFVVAAGGVDQADHAVLDEVVQLDRVRHRRGDAPGERLDERKTVGDAVAMTGGEWLTLHGSNDLQNDPRRSAAARPRRATAVPQPEAKTKRIHGRGADERAKSLIQEILWEVKWCADR